MQFPSLPATFANLARLENPLRLLYYGSKTPLCSPTMFGADISWDDDRSQTVGERKVRKEQKRRGSPTESSARSVVSSHVSSHVSSQVSSSSRATIVVAEPTNPWGPPSNDGLQVTSAGRPTTRDTGHDSKGSSFREARTDAWLAANVMTSANGNSPLYNKM